MAVAERVVLAVTMMAETPAVAASLVVASIPCVPGRLAASAASAANSAAASASRLDVVRIMKAPFDANVLRCTREGLCTNTAQLLLRFLSGNVTEAARLRVGSRRGRAGMAPPARRCSLG